MCSEYGNEGRAELAMSDGARSQTAEVNFDCQVGQVFYGDILDVSVIHGDLVLGSGGTLDSKVLVSRMQGLHPFSVRSSDFKIGRLAPWCHLIPA